MCLTSAAPSVAQTDYSSKHDAHIQPVLLVEKSKIDTKPLDPKPATNPNPKGSLKIEEPPGSGIVSAPAPDESKQTKTEEPVAVIPVVIKTKRYKWAEMRNNKTLERFQKNLLNEKIVPFLKKCDALDDEHLLTPDDDPDLSLCPVFYDNMLRLNNKTSAADSINSSDLEEFISESNKRKTFCEDVFAEIVNPNCTNFKYSKNLTEYFSRSMTLSCYNWCYEPNMGPLRNSSSCAAIAFIGTKLKTEVVTSKPVAVVDPVAIKNQDEEDPSLNEGELDQIVPSFFSTFDILCVRVAKTMRQMSAVLKSLYEGPFSLKLSEEKSSFG